MPPYLHSTSFSTYHLIYLSYSFTVLSMRTEPIFRNHPISALAVICIARVRHQRRRHHRQRRAAHAVARTRGRHRQLQWIVDAYTLVMSGLLLSAGGLSRPLRPAGRLIAGLAVFAVTSAFAAQVNSGRADRGPRGDGRRAQR